MEGVDGGMGQRKRRKEVRGNVGDEEAKNKTGESMWENCILWPGKLVEGATLTWVRFDGGGRHYNLSAIVVEVDRVAE